MKLNKDKLAEFVATLADMKVYAPKKCGEALRFALITKAGDLRFPASNTTVPAKSVVFPQTETMLRFQPGKTDISAPVQEGETAVLGVRPCDARAMSIVDNVFSWGVDDPYYVQRRADLTLVGLACLEPCANCFCTSVGGGPASKEGLDVLVTELGDGYLFEAITEKGEKLCAKAQGVLEDSSPDDLEAAQKLHKKAEGQINRRTDPSDVPARLPQLWESPLWGEVSAACLGCGICTYLCPTCHCFDMQDETEGFDGRRSRMWDSCMFAEYTLHTSGHNPRPTRRERTRNRINHKYSYFVDKFKVIACVGCGRCIDLCPVNIDILDILSKVGEETL